MMTDYLVLLLSTDWFLPFWGYLGIDVTENVRTSIKNGCREIVERMMNGVDQYYLINFSPERREQTSADLAELFSKAGLKEGHSELLRWANLRQGDFKAAWIYTRLTRDLLAENPSDGRPVIESAMQDRVIEAMTNNNAEQIDFVEISLKSRTDWDEFTRGLEAGLPEMLADLLVSVLRVRAFDAFWNRLGARLSQSEREELIGWYRSMARFRGLPEDVVPNCVGSQA